MFFGDSTHSLDAKHRVFVPKRFGEALQPEPPAGPAGAAESKAPIKVVLTRGFERCLFLFSDAGFERVLQRLQTQAFGGKELRKIQRMFFANTHRTQLDSAGRLVLPERLRTFAGIEKEVVLVGVADRAEVWDKAEWDRYEAENDDAFDDLDVVLVGQGGAE